MCLYEDRHFLSTRRGDNQGNLWICAHAHSKCKHNRNCLVKSEFIDFFIRRGVPNDINNNIVCVYRRKTCTIIDIQVLYSFSPVPSLVIFHLFMIHVYSIKYNYSLSFRNSRIRTVCRPRFADYPLFVFPDRL